MKTFKKHQWMSLNLSKKTGVSYITWLSLVMIFAMVSWQGNCETSSLIPEDFSGISKVFSYEKRPAVATSRSEGLLPNTYSNFVRCTGKDGLELDLTMPRQRKFSYTIMFWFRSEKSLRELR